MEATRDVGVNRVILASSGAVYGNQPHQPVRENAIPNPRSPYAVSKLSAEYYVKTIGAQYGIQTVCLRIFNAYGPGQRVPPVHTPVIPHFLRQAWENGTIVVHGDGNQTRDFVYAGDIAQAIIRALPLKGCHTMNVSTGQETSINDLIRSFEKAVGYTVPVQYTAPRTGDILRSVLSNETLKRDLGFVPAMDLEEGIRRTYDWYRSQWME